MSAVEAIDDLSSKLSITNLVASGGEPEELSLLTSSRPSSPSEQRAAPTPHYPANGDLVAIQQPKGRKANAKLTHKNGKVKASKAYNNKNQSRKRPAPSSDEQPKQDVKFPSRERADSVAEAVEAKAKKARLSPEESSSPDAAELPSNPMMVRRSKRNAAHRGEEAPSNTV